MSLISRRMLGRFTFSTSEQKTRLKWIDGKDIYCQTFPITTSYNPQTVYITLPEGYDSVVDWIAVMDISGGENNVNNLYYNKNSQRTSFISSYTYQGKLAFASNFNSGSKGKITVFYTKS